MCVLIFKCLCGYVTERERRTGERGSSQYVGKCQKPSKSQLLHKTLKSCRKPERREKKINQQYLVTYHSDWLEIVSADQ